MFIIVLAGLAPCGCCPLRSNVTLHSLLSMNKITLGERVASAVVGAMLGAVVGGILVWLFGVYSQNMGQGRIKPDAARWIMGCSAAFAFVGLVIGSHVGTALGIVFSAIHETERQGSNDVVVPTWLAVVLMVAVVMGVGWWVSHGS